MPARLAHGGQPRVQQIAYASREGPVAIPGRHGAGGEGSQILHQKDGQAFSLTIQPFGDLVRQRGIARRGRLYQFLDARWAQAGERDGGRSARALGARQQLAQAVSSRHQLAAPGHEQAQRLLAQSAHQVGEQLKRGAIGPMHDVEEDDAGPLAACRGEQDLPESFEEAALRTRTVQRRGRWKIGTQRRHLGQQTGGFAHPMRGEIAQSGGGFRLRDSSAQPGHNRAIRQIALTFIAARRDHCDALLPQVRQELPSQAGLADACLPFQRDQAPLDAYGLVGPDQGRPLRRPSHQGKVDCRERGRSAGRRR